MVLVYSLSKQDNDYQLEKFLDPISFNKNGANGKWDRRLKGAELQKYDLKVIYDNEKTKAAIAVYESPLWIALKAGEQNAIYWDGFYRAVPIKLWKLSNLFRALDNANSSRIGKQKSYVLDQLFKLGDMNALACLIALLRESMSRKDFTETPYIESVVFNLIFWSLSRWPLNHVNYKVFDYLREHIFAHTKRHILLGKTPWDMNTKDLEYRMAENRSAIGLAEHLGIIMALGNAEDNEFIFWYSKGNSLLIYEEMSKAIAQDKMTLPDTKKGLRWLIQNINRSRPKNKKLDEKSV